MKLSVLDVVSVTEGGSVSQALADSADLARTAEAAGYHRVWMAEHHAMPGIASSATAVALAHIGHATRTIRIGAGGIMLPNHNPFVIAEQFGTLDALFPGRVDLGLGRAPGADGRIANALRKDLMASAERFPQDVVELRALFAGDPRLPLQATPGQGANVQMWILGSSLFGAQLAAMLGMPYAFASHFAPDHLDAALSLYRDRFQPSETLEKRYVMGALNGFAADTDEEAAYHASSMEQMYVSLRFGTPGRLKPPIAGYRDTIASPARAMLEHLQQVSAIGSVTTVRERLAHFQERTRADELILSGATYDAAHRRRSLELAMEAAQGL